MRQTSVFVPSKLLFSFVFVFAVMAELANPAVAENAELAGADAFAEQLSGLLHARDEKGLLAVWDEKRLTEIVIRGIDLTESEKSHVHANGNYSSAVVKKGLFSYKPGSKFTFLRSGKKRNGNLFLLFRVWLADGGYSYLEFYIDRNANGRFQVFDALDYTSAFTFANGIRRDVLPRIVMSKKSDVGKLAFKDSLYIKYNEQLKEATRKSLDPETAREALAIFDTLPKALQSDPMISIVAVRASQKINDGFKEYSERVEWYLDVHKDNPRVYSFFITDAYVERKDYDRALLAIDDLDAIIGGDIYLDIQRADIYYDAGWPAHAEMCLRRVLDADPVCVQAIQRLAFYGAKLEDHDLVYESLMMTIFKLNVIPPDLTKIKAFEKFVESSQYEAYLERRSQILANHRASTQSTDSNSGKSSE